MDEGAAAALDGSASSDPEDGALTFAWTQTCGAPQVALTGADTARTTFTAPELEANAVLTFRLTVTDPGGAFASDAAAVTVRADNDAPPADAGVDLTIDDGDAATLDGSASSDPEGKALTYAWAQTGGTPTVALTGANTAAPAFTAPQVAAKSAIATDMRLRVLRSLRRAARTHAAQTAFALAQGAEDMRASLEAREARDTAAIDSARRAIKSARVGRAERAWASRHAHSAANLPTQRPERAAPLPKRPAPYGRGAALYAPALSAHENGAAREDRAVRSRSRARLPCSRSFWRLRFRFRRAPPRGAPPRGL